MADVMLTNQSSAVGTYDGQSTVLESLLVSVLMVDGLSMTMTADRAVWAGGMLTYSIAFENTTSFDLVAPVVTDILNPALIKLVTDSVLLDGSAISYTYDDVTGTLSVTLPDVEVGDTPVLTFQVQKA